MSLLKKLETHFQIPDTRNQEAKTRGVDTYGASSSDAGDKVYGILRCVAI